MFFAGFFSSVDFGLQLPTATKKNPTASSSHEAKGRQGIRGVLDKDELRAQQKWQTASVCIKNIPKKE